MPTDTKFDSYSDNVFNTGLGVLGMIVWQHLPDLRITTAQLSAMGTKHGLSELPKIGHPSDAFRRATTPVQHRDEKTQVRFLLRPVIDNKDTIIRHVVVEAVDIGHVKLEHGTVAWMKFDKNTSTMTTGIKADTKLPQVIQQVALDMCAEATRNYEDFRRSFTGIEMTRFSMKQLARMSHVSVHPNGGVYFVPASKRDQLKRLQRFIRDLSQYVIGSKPGFADACTFTVVPVPNLPEQCKGIEQSFRSSIDREMVTVLADVADLLGSTEKPGASAVQGKIESIAAIRAKADEYSKLLGITIEEINVKLGMLGEQTDELLQRAKTNAGDPVVEHIKRHPAIASGFYRAIQDEGVLHVMGGKGPVFSYERNARGYRIRFGKTRNLDSGLLARAECDKLHKSGPRVATKDKDVALLYIDHVLDKIASRRKHVEESASS